MESNEKRLEEVRNLQSEERMFELLKEDHPGVALEMAKSANTTHRVLEFLTRHHSVIVRHEVAKNPTTAIETLERLAEDKDMLVRDYANRNLAQRLYY